MRFTATLALLLLALSWAEPAPALAQTTAEAAPGASRTLRAVRLTTPLTLDGRLDEAIYTVAPGTGSFVQQDPEEDAPASEDTDVWVFFDEENIYVSARCWDSQPGREIANEMRRDGNLMQNESLVVTFDTFRDRRTGFYFQTNPVGGLRDQQINNERNANVDWNAVWDARSVQDEQGWTTEIVIPFKSLRYPAGARQVWGINFRRIVRWKNETSFFAAIPASFGTRGAFAVSFSADLVDLEVPTSSLSIELKPYAKASLDTDRLAAPPVDNDPGGDVGLDLKYGVTKGLVADLTLNTDFAQVESDVTQVNLSRAALFFPEKRDFFLEGQGIFGFGGAQQGTPGRSGLGPLLENGNAPSLIPSIFFSRRIGISGGQIVPIRVGGRLAGRAGAYSIGALNIQTGESADAGEPATNFSVVRIRRDVLGRSSVGVIATSRSPQLAGTGSSQAVGLDTSLRLGDLVTVTSYWARTRTPDTPADAQSYLGRLDVAADGYGLNVEHLSVGDGFTPEIGLVRRTAFRRTYGYARFSPRPASLQAIRKLSWEGSIDYLADRNGQLESREANGSFRIDLNNGDQFNVEYRHNYEFLDQPLTVASNVDIPPGSYSFQAVNTLYYLGPQRWLSGRVNLEHGSFYGGHKTQIGLSSRLDLGARLNVEPRLTVDRAVLPHTSFTSTLLIGRVAYSFSPRLTLASLVQYNSNTTSLSSNVRFRWEYIPGSDLFIVYTDNRDTVSTGVPTLETRSLAVKFTRLLRR